MVQRIGGETEYACSIRSEDREFQTWIIPAGGGVVRNMTTTSSGNLVMAESGVNRVALVEIAKN